ncbi:hypothetical protein LXA43DRAFT_1099177 [Ganoderma leucocontextum]|nr:hypothetical protein LXA43DRAFT_1099177 [Ganoderma leucocontextum]
MKLVADTTKREGLTLLEVGITKELLRHVLFSVRRLRGYQEASRARDCVVAAHNCLLRCQLKVFRRRVSAHHPSFIVIAFLVQRLRPLSPITAFSQLVIPKVPRPWLVGEIIRTPVVGIIQAYVFYGYSFASNPGMSVTLCRLLRKLFS